jgi:outer membrane lipoprotein-sorting protein
MILRAYRSFSGIVLLSLFVVSYTGFWVAESEGVVKDETIKKAFLCIQNKNVVLPSTEITAHVQKSYSALNGLASDFSQVSYLASLDEEETSFGHMSFLASKSPQGVNDKAAKMRWEYTKPEPQQFIVDGSTVWFYQALDRQVVVDEVRSLLLSEVPLAFLMGVGNLSEKFKLDKTCETAQGILLFMTVKDEKQSGQLDSFRLLVSPSSWLPYGAQILDLGGNTTTILFTKLQVNKKLPLELFKPNWPASIDIIDKRKQE